MKTIARLAVAAFLLTGLSFARDHDRRGYDDDWRYRNNNRSEYRNRDRGDLPQGIERRLRNGKPIPPGLARQLDRRYRYSNRDRYENRRYRDYDRYRDDWRNEYRRWR